MINILDWARRALSGAPAERHLVRKVLYEDLVEHQFKVLSTLDRAPRTIDNKRAAQAHALRALRGRDVSTIRPWEIAQLVKSIHDRGLHVTSRQVLQDVREAFNFALVEGWLDSNPALHVRRLPAPVRRQRLTLAQFLDTHEYARGHLPPWVAVCLRLALVTGQRRSDVVKMCRADVRDGHLFVQQYKTGARVAIPLALRLEALGATVGEVVDECLACEPHDGETLLRTAARPRRELHPQSISNRFAEAFGAACTHAGPGAAPSFHEIRSLSARLYRMQGIDTQTLLGHSKASMTEIYEDERGLNAGQWKYVRLPTISANELRQAESPAAP
jgi:integrase